MTQKEMEKILIKIVKEGVRTSANLNKLAIKVEKLEQASSLTGPVGDDRMNLERNNMDTTQLKRIADALEEILRLVKEDQEKMRKISEKN